MGFQKKWGRGVWILLPHACHGHGRVCKKFGIIWWDRQGKPLSNLPSGRPEWSGLYMVHVEACMRWPQPFGSTWAWPMWSPRQGVHEFGHNTHVASRRGTVLGFYHRKTPTKCIECQKWTVVSRHACYAHRRVCIKVWYQLVRPRRKTCL